MSYVIEAKNLSKKFRLQTLKTTGNSLRDALAGVLQIPLRRAAQTTENSRETLWALRDVSFEIQQGDTLGVIGSNGAGKSTLLKILSRITRPTSGAVRLRGRVGSLLEVGTGFHPELSGRENIYLNGAVLGMKKTEIARKFDEIVAFAEVDRFLDTPVKHYSSGMYMRLAFAVAAHLEPEILIVDEVLAVGDAAFQKKCLGKMNEVAGQGRTVLFVSHNAAALERLCKTALYLEGGRLKNFGLMKPVLGQYYSDIEKNHSLKASDRQDAEAVPDGTMRFIDWSLIDSSTNQKYSVYSRETVTLETTLVSKMPRTNVHFKLYVQNEQEQNLIIAHNLLSGVGDTDLQPGIYRIRWRLSLPLRAGRYKLFAEVYSANVAKIYDIWAGDPHLTVLPVLEHPLPEDFQGVVNLPVSFEIEAD